MSNKDALFSYLPIFDGDTVVIDIGGGHEPLRLAAVLDASGDNWDPHAVRLGEEEAYRVLYSKLDPAQLALYEQLVEAGVLPEGIGHEPA